jgi:hypothetical protein
MRKLTRSKPINSATVAKPAKAAKASGKRTAKPTPNAAGAVLGKAATEAAKPNTALRGLPRDLSGIAANRTHFGETTQRDNCYLAMLADFAGKHTDTIKLSAIRERHYHNPYYSPSKKATDVGAFNRLRAAGFVTVDTEAGSVRFANADAFGRARNERSKLKTS